MPASEVGKYTQKGDLRDPYLQQGLLKWLKPSTLFCCHINGCVTSAICHSMVISVILQDVNASRGRIAYYHLMLHHTSHCTDQSLTPSMQNKVPFIELFCQGKFSAPGALVIKISCTPVCLHMSAYMYVGEHPSDIHPCLKSAMTTKESLANVICDKKIQCFDAKLLRGVKI